MKQRQAPNNIHRELYEHHQGAWGHEIAASEKVAGVCSNTSERRRMNTHRSANKPVSERYMQGQPQGVHHTLADMWLRNKTKRLTNTALPVFIQ